MNEKEALLPTKCFF